MTLKGKTSLRDHVWDFEFFSLATQYYVAGRYLSLQMHIPVSANLLHHAVELFMKALLADKVPNRELASRAYGHKLVNLWERVGHSIETPEHLYEAVEQLDLFEDIRYPRTDRDSLSMRYALHKPAPYQSSDFQPGTYSLTLESVDELVSFLAGQPKLKKNAIDAIRKMPSHSITVLLEANRHKAAWVDV